jgi:hypothetical protein
MFSFLNCIIYDFFSLGYNPDLGTEFIPNRDKIAHIGSAQNKILRKRMFSGKAVHT